MSVYNNEYNEEEEKSMSYRESITMFAEKARREIKVNEQIKESIKRINIKLKVIKSIINNYFLNNTSHQKYSKEDIVKLLHENNTQLSKQNKELNEYILKLSTKLERRYDSLERNITSLKNELSQKREDNFLLSNQVILTENLLLKKQQELGNMNIIQEIRREVMITDMSKAEDLFDSLSTIYQSKFNKILKQKNYEKTRIILLKNKIEDLKSQLSKLKQEQPNNDNISIQNNTIYEEDSIDDFHFEEFDLSTSSLSLENITTNRSDKATKCKFPFQVKNHKKTKSAKNFPLLAVDTNKLKPPMLKKSIPKLNLKQIEFNKKKVKENNSSSSSKEEDNNDETDETSKVLSQILQMRQNIREIKKEISKHKHTVINFKSFYKRMTSKYEFVFEK